MEGLIAELIAQLGFSRAADLVEWLPAHPAATPGEVVDEVLRAEGLDPITTDRALRSEIGAVVERWAGRP